MRWGQTPWLYGDDGQRRGWPPGPAGSLGQAGPGDSDFRIEKIDITGDHQAELHERLLLHFPDSPTLICDAHHRKRFVLASSTTSLPRPLSKALSMNKLKPYACSSPILGGKAAAHSLNFVLETTSTPPVVITGRGWNIGWPTLCLLDQGVHEAVARRPAREHHMPRLDIGVRRRTLGQGEGLIHQLTRHRLR
jgi:hypothetical protein